MNNEHHCVWNNESGKANVSGLLLNLVSPVLVCLANSVQPSELHHIAKQHKQDLQAVVTYICEHPDDAHRELEAIQEVFSYAPPSFSWGEALGQLQEHITYLQEAIPRSAATAGLETVKKAVDEFDETARSEFVEQLQLLLSFASAANVTHQIERVNSAAAQELAYMQEQGLLLPSSRSPSVSPPPSPSHFSARLATPLGFSSRSISLNRGGSMQSSPSNELNSTEIQPLPLDTWPAHDAPAKRSVSSVAASVSMIRSLVKKLRKAKHSNDPHHLTAQQLHKAPSSSSSHLPPHLSSSSSFDDTKAADGIPAGQLLPTDPTSRNRATCIEAASSLAPVIALGMSSGSTYLHRPDPYSGDLHRIASLNGHCGAITCITKVGEGQALITGSLDASVIIWQQIAMWHYSGIRIRCEQPVVQLAVSAMSSKLVVAHGSSISVWSLSGNEFEYGVGEVRRLGVVHVVNQGVPRALAIAPMGDKVFAGVGRQVHCWAVGTSGMEAQGSFTAHYGDISCLAVDTMGQVLASGSSRRSVKMWDVSTLTEGKVEFIQALAGHESGVRSMAFDMDRNVIRTCGKAFNNIKVYENTAGSTRAASWKKQKVVKTKAVAERIMGVAASPEGLPHRFWYMLLAGGRLIYKKPCREV